MTLEHFAYMLWSVSLSISVIWFVDEATILQLDRYASERDCRKTRVDSARLSAWAARMRRANDALERETPKGREALTRHADVMVRIWSNEAGFSSIVVTPEAYYKITKAALDGLNSAVEAQKVPPRLRAIGNILSGVPVFVSSANNTKQEG